MRWKLRSFHRERGQRHLSVLLSRMCWVCGRVSSCRRWWKNVFAVPKIDSGGLFSGTEELQKAISMGLLDTALLLGWELECTFDDDDEVLFSQRCHFACVRELLLKVVVSSV